MRKRVVTNAEKGSNKCTAPLLQSVTICNRSNLSLFHSIPYRLPGCNLYRICILPFTHLIIPNHCPLKEVIPFLLQYHSLNRFFGKGSFVHL